MADSYITREYLQKQFQNYSSTVKDTFAKKVDVAPEKIEYENTDNPTVTNVKTALDTLFSGGTGDGEENAIESISVNGTPITPDVDKNVDITVLTVSAETDNMIEIKADDGIYVKDMSTKISAEQDNALVQKTDGLYVPTVAEAKVSQEQNNIIISKDDGLFAEDAIVEIKVDGTAVQITDKTVDIALKAVTDLENYYDKEEVDDLISAIVTLNISVVDVLPTADISTTTIYLVAKTDTEQNIYSEYICLDATVPTWECIGDTEVDLTEYAKTDDVNTALELKADKTELDVYVTDTELTNKCYATETFVTDKIAEIEIPSLDGYAKTEDIPTVTNDLTDELKEQYDKAEENVQSDWDETDEISDAFIKNKPTIPSLNGYATETWVNEQGFLTQHQDLSNYATKDEIPTVLPANGGNSDTVNNHTIKSDVPENAVFTDTVYDDSALKTELTTAIATAKSEAIETILGEAVSEDFDTLQEVADWIQADTTNSAELIIRVTNAESDID